MKKILNALFLTLLAVFTFSSCSDVPAPYEILGEGDVPGLTGDGTKENPYNIEAAQQKQDGSTAWVQGYIVGALENIYDDKGEFAGNKANFVAPFNITTNVLIAESPDETNENKCLPVKVKGGSDLSNALNLKDHPENKGGILLIQGELNSGFGKAALINTTAAVFNNKEVGEEQGGEDLDPDNPLGLDTSVAPLADFSNNFDDVQHQADYSRAGWINKAIKGKRIWQGAIYDPQKYLAASTYGVNNGETAEYWFVTPYFTVSADKKFTFNATVNKYTESMSLKVFFLQLKDGKMEQHEIAVSGIPTSGSYQWTNDLAVNLSTYAGQDGFIGFQYVATRGDEVQTYGIDDIVYGEGGDAPVGDDPFGLDASSPKSTFEASFEEITDFNQNYNLDGWINKAIRASNVWQTGIFNNVDKYIKATPYNVAAGETMEAWFITPAFTVNSTNKFTFDCAGANWKDDMMLKVFFLQKDANGNVTRNEIIVDQIPTSGTNFEWVKDIAVDLNNYNGKVGFVGFQYTVVSTGVNKGLPTYQIDNVKYAIGEGGGENPSIESVIFSETFGETLSAGSTEKFAIANFDEWTNAVGLLFSTTDPDKKIEIRRTKTISNCVWLPAKNVYAFRIENINTAGYHDLVLSYKLLPNTLASSGIKANQTNINVKCGEQMMTIPSVELTSTSEYKEIEITGVPEGLTSIEFISTNNNLVGFRLDDITLKGKK